MNNNVEFFFTDFEESSYNELRDLWIETSIETPGRGDTLEVIQQTLAHDGKLILMRKSDDNLLLGSSWITNDGRRLYIHHFAIAKKFQGRGLGKKLLQETLRFVKGKNMQVKLEVSQHNTAAIKLYTQYGFKPLGEYDVYIIRDVQNIQFLANE